MIRVRRNPVDDGVRDWLAERATRLRELLATGQEPTEALLNSYRDKRLKDHLVAEAHGKCIYCESKVTHLYFGDVEHIKPKSRFPQERLDLNNLGFVCALCNNAKGNFWNDEFPLLNPYEDDLNAELLVFGCMITRQPGRNRARLTVDELDLNRTGLLERRKERIEQLENLAEQYKQAPEGPVKQILRAELLREAEDEREYAVIVRAYIASYCNLQYEPAA